MKILLQATQQINQQLAPALNLFLRDIYDQKHIVADGVIPEEFIFRSPGYLPQCEGIVPVRDIYSHISGIDLVKGKDGKWYILEDNLRIPSGASYPLIARELCRRCSPEAFHRHSILDNRNYGDLLRGVMDSVNTGGINVVFTPGRYNAAYFEHSYLAEKAGAVLAESSDLYVRDSVLYYRSTHGDQRVGAIYRRVSDEYMDPLIFQPDSLIGIPNLMAAYRAGHVAVLNAFGNGVAEAGGYGVVFGSKLTAEQLEDMRRTILAQPRRFIAQEVIDFQELPILEGDQQVDRKADLRAFVLTGANKSVVWPSGLTRFSRNPDSFIVNSSQGGGFKDTWIRSH